MENPIKMDDLGIPLILETSICTFIHSALLAHHYSPLILRKLFGVEDDFFTKPENYGGFPQNLQESHEPRFFFEIKEPSCVGNSC